MNRTTQMSLIISMLALLGLLAGPAAAQTAGQDILPEDEYGGVGVIVITPDDPDDPTTTPTDPDGATPPTDVAPGLVTPSSPTSPSTVPGGGAPTTVTPAGAGELPATGIGVTTGGLLGGLLVLVGAGALLAARRRTV